MDEQDIASFEVRPEALAALQRTDQRDAADRLAVGLRELVPRRNATNVTLWPDFRFRFRHHTRRFDEGATSCATAPACPRPRPPRWRDAARAL